MRIVRSILAIMSGLFLLSLVAEGIELAVVTALHGSFTQDQALYFGIRNRPAVLGAKLVYNTGAAFLAGYAAAWVAGRAAVLHGTILAIIQLALFVWGMAFSEFAGTTPLWAWLTLVPLMAAGILLGAFVQNRQRTLTVLTSGAGAQTP